MNIAITIGDCNGIGIEILIKALHKVGSDTQADFTIVSNRQTLQEYINYMNLDAKLLGEKLVAGNREFQILDCMAYSPVNFGIVSRTAGELAAESIERAVSGALSGEFDAIVTMPVSKEALYLAGWKYPGHTEMIADRCGSNQPLMILAGGNLRVALATIHIPLRQVAESLNSNNLNSLLNLFNKSLISDFAIKEPRIAMLGLNPHAGEGGNIGTEELAIIQPSIEHCRAWGINVQGPFPADGFFAHGEYTGYDGILAMYHDQGLIPLKLLAGGAGVNFTAGLKIIRTSVDHGTAFGIAGKGVADEKSALNAIEMAIEIAENRANVK